jgi:uncharacterized repeat protein (TIGR01451 family)
MNKKTARGFVGLALALVLFLAITGAPVAPASAQGPAGNVAYVFYGNDAEANSFKILLESAAYTVQLVPLGSVLSTNFSPFDLILVANDSGNLDQWGTAGLTAAQVAKITEPNKPIIGIGEGGYAFFGRLTLYPGWPHGWHGPQDKMDPFPSAPGSFFNTLPAGTITHYTVPVNSVGIYLSGVPADVSPVGLEVPTKDHSSLILQGCRLLWGGSGSPDQMTADGKTLFLNSVQFMRTFQCPTVPSPDPGCLSVAKTASPANGTAVVPGQVITYTLNYTYSNDPNCLPAGVAAQLHDAIPADTTFVLGSATDGHSPGVDGALSWTVTRAAGSQTKQFQVVVSANQCVDQRLVNNQAMLIEPSKTPLTSNTVSHPVTCPPVGLPNNNPFYAEDEIQVHPYPLVAGYPSQISVRVQNTSAAAQNVSVQFQIASTLGVGLVYMTIDTKTATLPALGTALLSTLYTPPASGQYSIQIVVTGPGLNQPLVTQSNLDVSEDFVPGAPDTLTFPVRNNTGTVADLLLVIRNACPGWTAQITSPSGGVLAGMTPDETRTATLQVIPPTGTILGTKCFIDVEVWSGATLVGGIRKLDVPPVHLPPFVSPPWDEPEIILLPNPPVVGSPGKFCVELSNPLTLPKSVTVDFSAADFGAGIGFTPVASQAFDLPPNSFNRYCANWTPAAGGTLHRCLLVTLKQPGFRDMPSQKNVDIEPGLIADLSALVIPLRIGNPDGVPHALSFRIRPLGIDPFWTPQIVPRPGELLPAVIQGGQVLDLQLVFMGSGSLLKAPPLDYRYGSASQVEVAVLLDGRELSGFTVTLNQERLYLPAILRQ